VAGFVFASAPFLYLFVTAWWQLIFVRFYHGFATAIFVPVAEAFVAELYPTKRGERISLISSATYVGRVAAPILGGTILFITNSGFHVLYLAVATAGISALVTGFLFLAKEKTQVATTFKVTEENVLKRVLNGWKTVVTEFGVLVTCLVQASQYYAFGVVEFYLSGYLKESMQFDWLLTGIVMGSLVALPVFVKPYIGRASDRTGRRTPIALGCVVSGLPLILIPFVSDFWILLALALMYGLGFAAVTAVTPALVSELAPSEITGASMGFLDMMMDVGQTLGPIISGFILASAFGYAGVFLSLAAVLLLCCLAFVLLRIETRH
jgi:MFS family permease